MTPKFARLAKRSKESTAPIGRYGYEFALMALDELEMILRTTSEKNPVVVLINFRKELIQL